MHDSYDVIIVGGGPAGIFAALELSQAAGLKVLILEKGKDLDSRHCPTWGKGMTVAPVLPAIWLAVWGEPVPSVMVK